MRSILLVCFLVLFCSAASAQNKSKGFIERTMPRSSFPELAEGRIAVAKFEVIVQDLDKEYNAKFNDAIAKMKTELSQAREKALEDGHPEEAERLIAFPIDLPKRGLVEARRIWAHSGGHFECLFNGLWFEFVPTGFVCVLEETNRTSGYVELSRLDANIRVRLESNRCLLKFDTKPFMPHYDGEWKQGGIAQDADVRRRKMEAAIKRISEVGQFPWRN